MRLLALSLMGWAILSAQESPVIRVNVPMVQVDVIVRGKDGAVAGLTKEDFTILDRGKPQRIVAFNVGMLRTRRECGATALAPGTVSNRETCTGAEPRAPTAGLWGTLNTEVEDQVYVRN